MEPSRHHWHTLSSDEALAALRVDRQGLQQTEAQNRFQTYGPNELGGDHAILPLQIILQQLKSPLIYVLLIAAIISFLTGHAVDAIVIMAIVVVNTAIGFLQEYRAEKSLEALRQLAAPKALVLRDGRRLEIAAAEVVPGDITILATGDKVPADARIIDSSNLRTDEAPLTGDSVSVDKDVEPVLTETPLADRSDMIYAGTNVVYGRGEAVVVATGRSTEVGKIAEQVSTLTREPTPLQRRLAHLGSLLAVIALILATLVFVVGLIRGIGLFDIFLFAVASAVASIPEGLPAVVTIVLAVGLQRMAARNAIIRKLPAVETLGSASVICSDKTGTLTKNEMTVKALYTFGSEYEVTGEGYEPEGAILRNDAPIQSTDIPELHRAIEAAVLCNDSELRREGDHWKVSGDPTEGALITLAEKIGLEKTDAAHRMPRLNEIPFDSHRAYMATLHEGGENHLIFVKGAPEKVVDLCGKVMVNGEVVDFTEKRKKQVLEANHAQASRALRVLALAQKETSSDNADLTTDDLHDMVFLGLAGMIDPPRPEAIGAIEKCKRAGILVMMATGDNKTTAGAIAYQMGILEQTDGVVEGVELDKMSDEELAERIGDIRVFARVEPQHKLRIVTALQRRGHVVAVTGDGVNDAPALKRADIGIAMGITGTDVAKEASEMTLTDDNFASIVGAVEEGRIIFRNIQKVLANLLPTNAGEQLTILTTISVGLPLPLTAVQILWVNLVTDSFPSLALAADPVHEDVLSEPVRERSERIVSRFVIMQIIFVAVITAAGTIGMFIWGLNTDGIDKARTLAFVTMAVFQLFHALNVRSATASIFRIGIFSNMWLVAAILIAFGLQVAAVEIPFMQVAFNTSHLTAREWLLVIGVSSTVLWASEIRKLIAARLSR